MVKKKKVNKVSKTKAGQASLAEKTEQILLTMPKIIATQIGKDLTAKKQEEIKLNLELKKLELQKKRLTEKIPALKRKDTSVAKKQVHTSQKSLQKIQQQIAFLIRNQELLKKQSHLLTQKKAMYIAFQDKVIHFKKEWIKKMGQKVKPEAKIKTEKPIVIQKLSEKQNSPVVITKLSQESKILNEAPVNEQAEFVQEPREKVS